VVRTWSQQTRELAWWTISQYVQVFENKGAIMGCSNPSPPQPDLDDELYPQRAAKESWRYLNTSRSIVGACYAIILELERELGERSGGEQRSFHGSDALLGGLAV